jgi:chemotaxis protein methyltransferase CheR
MPSLARTSAEIRLFRDLLSKRSGIDFGRHRELLLENRLRRRMAEAGARSLYEYYRMVTAGEGELQALVDEVSIQETSFFRNPPQFELLGSVVLPERVSLRLRDGHRRLRLWSAGCSTGQEAYSLAIVLLETVVLPETWEVRVLGTDLSARALGQAVRGAYDPRQVDGLAEARLRGFFERKHGGYVARDWVRQGVEFLKGSVLDEPPLLDCDVVFCRNVMIYFDRDRQRQLVSQLARAVAPGGYLFLGHTESLAGLTDAFRMVCRGRAIAYQRLP